MFIETQRLILRRIGSQDAQDIFEYASDEQTTQFMLFNKHTTIDDTISFIKFMLNKYELNECLDFAFVLKETGKVIGTGGAANLKDIPHSVEIGYILNKKYWGQGLVVEAMQAVMKYLFGVLNVHRIYANHFINNTNSGKVMTKLGMSYEGTSIDSLFVRGKYITTNNYAVINPNHK